VAAAKLVRTGRVFSLSIPVDDKGPQTGGFGRFNPIHLMIRDGCGAVTGTTVRDFYGGRDRWIRGTDDLLIMPLQSGTQWDALAHIVFDGKIYNGYDATEVGNKGARRNDITRASDRVVGRGVLLDIPRSKGRSWLEPGEQIHVADLEACARSQGVSVGRGDMVLLRTGHIAQCRAAGSWGTYAGGPAPGLALDTAEWIHERELAAVACDTWGLEVLPNQTPDVFQPLHIVLIVHMGLLIGEIFDLEPLADDCAKDGVYEFLFSAAPLAITGAVGSPVNPIAVK
jgi:kynurenine formamidase